MHKNYMNLSIRICSYYMMSSFISEIGSKPDEACTIYWATRYWGKIARSEGGGRLEGACEAMIAAREAMIQT